ncbi:hypothetical protein [Ancylobacter sp. IITR112]|uniref:spike base protein, RCAP_Rcc01079 family n=1 Tax=Ancylobacter sp. IITR112 TaxID=3138073 RepID=UPI00352BBC83
MADSFATHAATPTAPARRAFDITPSDSTDLAEVPKALYVNGAGTIKVTMVAGGTVTFTVASPGPLDIGPARVWATGTTATGIIGLL